MQGRLLLRAAALTAAAGVSAAVAAPAFAANVVTNPSTSQTIDYGASGCGATCQTIIKMVTGATADPFVIKNGSSVGVFSVTPTGGLILAGPLTIGGGTPITKFSSGLHSLTVGPVSAHDCVIRAFNPLIAGVAVGDSVIGMPQGNGATPIETADSGDVIWTTYVGFGGKVEIKACNVGPTNVTVTAENWRIDVIKH